MGMLAAVDNSWHMKNLVPCSFTLSHPDSQGTRQTFYSQTVLLSNPKGGLPQLTDRKCSQLQQAIQTLILDFFSSEGLTASPAPQIRLPTANGQRSTGSGTA